MPNAYERSARYRTGNLVSDTSASVSVVGLADFNRALSVAGKEYSKAANRAGYDLARTLVKRAREVASRRSIRTASKAAKSLRVSRGASFVAISGGGPKYPYFWGAEFGARNYRQFEKWRGNQWGGWDGGPGYFLNPTIRQDGPALIRRYMDDIGKVTDKAFPEAS